jgi:xylulokinase
MRPELVAALGLEGEVLLVSGGHDQACAALGCGAFTPGRAMVSTGTAEVVEVVMPEPVLDEKLGQAGISIYSHVVPEHYLAMTLNHSGGLLLRWYRDTLCQIQNEQSRSTGASAYDLILRDAPEGPTGLLVLPHFAGAGTPLLDTRSKGAIIGLTFSSTRSAIAKAMLEGLTFELRRNVDLLRGAGVPVEELHAVGGGARSPLWTRLKADICGVPLRLPENTEAACLGAALLAATGTGHFETHQEAVKNAVKWRGRIEPDRDSQQQYEKFYPLYLRLYPAIRQIQHGL